MYYGTDIPVQNTRKDHQSIRQKTLSQHATDFLAKEQQPQKKEKKTESKVTSSNTHKTKHTEISHRRQADCLLEQQTFHSHEAMILSGNFVKPFNKSAIQNFLISRLDDSIHAKFLLGFVKKIYLTFVRNDSKELQITIVWIVQSIEKLLRCQTNFRADVKLLHCARLNKHVQWR